MNKISVGIEYESHTTTAITGGRIMSVTDIVNAGGESDFQSPTTTTTNTAVFSA